MANSKNSAIREMVLDRCLKGKRKYTMQDLMDACNKELRIHELPEVTSLNTIRQDLRNIESRFYISIEDKRVGRNIYYSYKDSTFSIFNAPLTDEELHHLNDTLSMLKRFEGLPQFRWISEMNTRLEANFMSVGEEKPIIGFDENPYTQGIGYLTQLYEAICHHSCLKLTYRPFLSSEAKVHEIHPYYLKQYNGRWFLFGWSQLAQRLNTYALDRIEDVTKSDTKYIENTMFDFQEYFEDIIGVSINENNTLEKVVLWFSKEQLQYVKTKPLHGSQRLVEEKELGGIVEIQVMLNFELEQLLLSFGERVKVLEPKELVDKIKNRIAANIKNYA